MATVTSSYAIGVTIDADGTGFVTGTQSAEQAVQDLATTTQTAAADIDTSLATDIPASADASALNLTTKASKFKAVGTELGSTFAGGLGSGMSGTEAAASTAQSLTGLLSFVATSATGVIGLVGLGIGTSVVTNIVKGMNERRQEVTDTVNGILGSMELSVESTMKDIRKAIFDGLSFQATATSLGGGDLEAGLAKIQQLAEDYGVSLRTAGQLIEGRINPATEELRGRLEEAAGEGIALGAGMGKVQAASSDTANFARGILGSVTTTREEVDRSKAGAETLRGIYQDTAVYSGKVAADAATTAYQLALAATSANDIASGLSNAAQKSGLIDTQ